MGKIGECIVGYVYSAFQHTDNVHSNFSLVETSDIIKVGSEINSVFATLNPFLKTV